MKRFLLITFVSFCILHCKTSNGQIINSDFEMWTVDSTGTYSLDNWSQGNIVEQSSGLFGNYSVRLASFYNWTSGHNVGGTIGQLNFPLNSNPDSITGWYKTNDLTARVSVYFSVLDSTGFDIGNTYRLLSPTLSWSRFSLPINYGFPYAANTGHISIENYTQSDSEYVDIDHIELISNLQNQVEDVGQLKDPIELLLQKNTIIVKNKSNKEFTDLNLQIVDLENKQLANFEIEKLIKGINYFELNNVSNSPGIYIGILRSKEIYKAKKIIIF